MRLPDDRKRQQICAAAARLFATRQFHEVRLDDVAAAAKVGKGTLYVYFRSKEDLYFSLVYEGFTDLVARLRQQVSEQGLGSVQKLERVVAGLVDFAYQHPHVFELIRRAGVPRSSGKWEESRRALSRLIEDVIRTGVRRGELADPHPEITALFIPGLVRSAMLFAPRPVTRNVLRKQMMHLLRDGLTEGARA